VKWEAVSPDLKFSDSDAGARMLRNHILGGAGFPEHWFGGGGDVNRATSAEMGTPVFKRITARQKKVKYIFETIGDYQISQALKAGRLKGIKNPYAYSVVIPEMVAKDLSINGAVIQAITFSIVSAIQQRLIDTETARKIFSVPISQLGVEIDLKSMAEKVAKEQEQKAAQDYVPPDTGPPANPDMPIKQAGRIVKKLRLVHG
jgi:hypothetical protein